MKTDKKASIHLVKLTLDIAGFGIILAGAVTARFTQNEYVLIIGGIMVAVGMGLLGVARLVK